MTIASMKKQIHLAVDNIESQAILKAIQLILDTELKHKNSELKTLSLDEFYTRNNTSQKEIKQGKLISHKELKAKFKAK